MSSEQADQSEVTRARYGIFQRVIRAIIGLVILVVVIRYLRHSGLKSADYVMSVCGILLALELVYTAFTGPRQFTIGLSGLNEHASAGRFLVVEPPSDQCDAAVQSRECASAEEASNPYAPPKTLSIDADELVAGEREAILNHWAEHFLNGDCFIHQGVVLFLDEADDSVVHAAIAVASPTESVINLSVNEAQRSFGEFLRHLPKVVPIVHGRSLEVRLISTYEDLASEVAERVRVPWSSVLIAGLTP